MSIKKSLLWSSVAAVCALTSGCNAIRNYSVRSYQGPMPLTEYQHMDAIAHGIPAPQPVAASTPLDPAATGAAAP